MEAIKILVGGQALRNLGSDRYTNDVDYLVNDTTSKKAFITSENEDLLNANGNKLFAEIYKIEVGNEQASAQSLFELKAFALIQHYQNFNFKKAAACEYDLRFLYLNYGIKECKIAKKYITCDEYNEVKKIINESKW